MTKFFKACIQSLLVLLVCLVLGDVAIVLYYKYSEKKEMQLQVRSPVYDGWSERDAFWAEANGPLGGSRIEPYTYWRRNAFDGEYIHIDQKGLRRTVKTTPGPVRQKVFMFGGSTMWGNGVPDEGTIASFLQGMLPAEYEVTNFGESGYVAAQELNELLFQLANGNIPDIVIFYDGVNDSYSGVYSPAVPRAPQKVGMIQAGLSSGSEDQPRSRKAELFHLVFRNYLRLAKDLATQKDKNKVWDDRVGPRIPENARQMARYYDGLIRQVQGLGKEYGFTPYFFWQPNLWTGTRTQNIPFERQLVERESPTLLTAMRAAFEAAAKQLGGREKERVYDLSHIFDRAAEPIYIDGLHVGAKGNQIIAAKMRQVLNL